MTWYPGKNVARTKNLDFSRFFCGASVFMDLQGFPFEARIKSVLEKVWLCQKIRSEI